MNIDVSVVMVNYKEPKLTLICLESIYKFTKDVNFEIIVVDNNSEDNSEQLITASYPLVKWINSGFNAGTSIAYNIGVKNSKGEYILIINNDTEFVENTLIITLDYYKELEKTTKVGMLGCQIIGYDDIIQYNSNTRFIDYRRLLRGNPIAIKLNLFQTKISDEERLKLHLKDHQPAWMGIPFGFVNSKVFTEDAAFFDEDIFMYFDDVEWCYRLKKLGYNHFFTTKTTVIHYNGGSMGNNFSGWRYGQIIISDWLGLIKIYGRAYFLFCMSILFFNITLDNFFYFIKPSKRDPEIKKMIDLDRKMFFKYFPIILFSYSKKTSKAKKFLKYELS